MAVTQCQTLMVGIALGVLVSAAITALALG